VNGEVRSYIKKRKNEETMGEIEAPAAYRSTIEKDGRIRGASPRAAGVIQRDGGY